MLFSELPTKEGMLFADEEQEMEIDSSITAGLIAPAKISLFEVENDYKVTMLHFSATY